MTLCVVRTGRLGGSVELQESSEAQSEGLSAERRARVCVVVRVVVVGCRECSLRTSRTSGGAMLRTHKEHNKSNRLGMDVRCSNRWTMEQDGWR